jgi:hypothetical protein
VHLAVQNTVWFVTKHLAVFVVPQTQKQLQKKTQQKEIIVTSF